MINAIQLFGTFVLTVLGFVVPILTILISLFPEGVKSLAEKYENEKRQSEENIINETKKKSDGKGLDINAIEKTLKILKKKKRDAEVKLGYLKPIKFLLKTSIPFVVSFVAVLIALFDVDSIFIIVLLTSSLISLVAGFVALFQSIIVVFEVGEIINGKKGSNDEKIIALLSTLVEKTGGDPYLKAEDIEVNFNKISLKKGIPINFSADKKYEIPVSIHNRSDKMAKVVEVGFIFPKNVIIEKSSNFEITTTEQKQIVRFKDDTIQAHNDMQQGNIDLTFLDSKEIAIDVFIKGENVKYTRFSFKLNIIK